MVKLVKNNPTRDADVVIYTAYLEKLKETSARPNTMAQLAYFCGVSLSAIRSRPEDNKNHMIYYHSTYYRSRKIFSLKLRSLFSVEYKECRNTLLENSKIILE